MKKIYDIPRDATEYLCSDEDIKATDEVINAALPNAAVGTIITTAGYKIMKQKSVDGTWKRLNYVPTPDGWVNPSDATATADDILYGKTAYIADGSKAVGTIQSKAAETYTPTTEDQTIAADQYLSGAQTVKGDANLVAGNIKSGVTIFGVEGTYAEFAISVDPQSVTAAEGSTVYFTVGAVGAASYQWQFKAGDEDWADSPATGNQTNTLTIPVTTTRDGYQYHCVVTSDSGATLTSEAATLVVSPPIPSE